MDPQNDETRPRDLRRLVAEILLTVFVLAATAGGFSINVHAGLYSLAAAAFAAAFLLGAE